MTAVEMIDHYAPWQQVLAGWVAVSFIVAGVWAVGHRQIDEFRRSGPADERRSPALPPAGALRPVAGPRDGVPAGRPPARPVDGLSADPPVGPATDPPRP